MTVMFLVYMFRLGRSCRIPFQDLGVGYVACIHLILLIRTSFCGDATVLE
jgi:hypothetical protein